MFKKILYPTDFSESAGAALEYVKKLRDAGAEEVILLHVYDSRAIDLRWEIESEYRNLPMEKAKHDVVKRMLEASYGRLEGLKSELEQSGLKTELIVIEGIPYQEIVNTAKDKGASLIVMGSHGEHGLVERIVGSTTGRVLRETPVPILVVRPRKEGKTG